MNYDTLRLNHQLCFPLYAASKEIVRRYKPYLDPFGLTYTQYITMMVFFEHEAMNIKSLGAHLYLDSGTLTPVVKKLEAMGYVKRSRLPSDERHLVVSITDKGRALQDKLLSVPEAMTHEFSLTESEAKALYQLLYKLIGEKGHVEDENEV